MAVVFIPVLKSGVLMFVWWAFKPLVFTFCPKLMKTEGVPGKSSVLGIKGSSGIIMENNELSVHRSCLQFRHPEE